MSERLSSSRGPVTCLSRVGGVFCADEEEGALCASECERVVKNAGMPKRRAKNTFGDLYVEFDIEMPESMEPVKAKVLCL